MQIFKAVFGVLLLLFCLTGCKTYKEPQPITQKETEIVTKTITKTQRDTIIQVKADSSYYEAYIDCRDGKPKILDHSSGKPQKVRPGKNLKPPTAKIDENGKAEKVKDGKYLYTKEGLPARVQRVGYPDSYRKVIVDQTGDKYLLPAQ